MTTTWPLRARILGFVVIAVVLPLTIAGVWLARSTNNAAEGLVAAQLDSALAQSESRVNTEWANINSNVQLLADNVPVVTAMRSAGASMPGYVDEALASMPNLRSVVFRARDGAVRWRASADGEASTRGDIALRAAIVDTDSSTLGNVDVRIAASALLPSDAPHAPTGLFVALYDRDARSWSGAIPLPTTLLEHERFSWSGEQWMASRRQLDQPPIDLLAAAPLDPVLAPFERTTRIGLIAMSLVAALVVVGAAIGTTRLTSSLGELATAADAVARGDFGVAVRADGSDDVGRVAKAFNSMSSGIRSMMHERSQREALAALGELSATVAHQIRTPLTSMRIDLQCAEELVSGDAAGLVSHALQGVERIESAVAASLQMARGGAEAFASVEVSTLLQSAAGNAAPRALANGIALDIASGDALFVHGDRGALVQMLTNVIINAVEAARSSIRVSSRAVDQGVEIVVADDGAGIPGSLLARVGEPFYSTKPSGTGLGLAIARRIIDAHRGSLAFSSSEAGTVVTMRLPG